MRRGPYTKVAQRNAALLERIRALKADHPFWGYRRMWAYLRYVDGLVVNQKRIYGVMKAADLLVRPNLKLRARRKADTRKPRPTCPNQWWGIDMTKVMLDGFGWVDLVVVLDWHTKKVVGHYAGLQARAWHWLVALNRAVNRQFPDGIEGRSLNLMADNGCQPTALAFMRACAAMGIRQAFTSYNNPKGNADTERFLRTLKEELVWLHEWTSPAVFFDAFERWIAGYNQGYLHSTLGYRSPEAFEAEYLSRATPLPAAC
jgi:transposase InsO family protein